FSTCSFNRGIARKTAATAALNHRRYVYEIAELAALNFSKRTKPQSAHSSDSSGITDVAVPGAARFESARVSESGIGWTYIRYAASPISTVALSLDIQSDLKVDEALLPLPLSPESSFAVASLSRSTRASSNPVGDRWTIVRPSRSTRSSASNSSPGF